MSLVRVRNATRGSMVAARAELAKSPLRRLVGLIGRRGWDETDGLLIRPCNSIHTCFMRMPIDVVFADRDGVVLDVVPARPPWRLGPLTWRAAWVLELPVGAIAASATRLDDRLTVEWVAAPREAGRSG
jgi:uncharacterized membrane protein (UPF0127 family)